MADAKNLAQAQATYAVLCQTLDHENWHYEKDDEKMQIDCKARGDDLPMDLRVRIDADRLMVRLFSYIPFSIEEDKRLEMAIAVSAVNNMLVDGNFDYDVEEGHLFFRMTNTFLESTISEAVCRYLIFCSCQIIDEFNDKFLMLAKGMISIQQFLAAIQN